LKGGGWGKQTYHLFNLAMRMIIRDGIDPMVAHNTLCEIREYRAGLAADVPIPVHLKAKFKREVRDAPSFVL
jgi:hypothetical protein